MKLGVFDSGIGGEAVATALHTYFPEAEVMTVNDRGNVPYGDKAPEHIISLTDAAIQPLLEARCDIIVLACNTATAVAIETLRARYPAQKFIGVEPMVKTAATLTKSGVIGVCATPATLRSERYHKLKEKYAEGLRLLEPDCGTWAYMIENNDINQQTIDNTIDWLCQARADVIVLGCTHYHWIKEQITKATHGRAQVIEPSEALARRVESLMGQPETPRI